MHNLRTSGSAYPFILYILFVTVYLGAQMFQGFSWLDIGFYMSGYQHFTDEPYVSYFLGQWLLSFQLTSWLCKAFSIDSYLWAQSPPSYFCHPVTDRHISLI